MSEVRVSKPTEHGKRHHIDLNLGLFTLLLLLLIGGAIVRSAIATRLDGFTIDEAYHIAAGVSYVRYSDFRINPEHPPLVKLWVGSLISATGFHLSNIRPFADKADERDFAEEDVYFNNDFNSVQRRARIAMWTLSGLLLLALAFAARRAFGPGVALGILLFLAIDPTVAAHLPVVMTDLPVSLLSAIAVVLTIRAFQDWAWKDLVACSMALGLALATKHSAPVFLIFVILLGAVLAFVQPISRLENGRSLRFAKLMAVAAGALIILWGFYFFRFAESNTGHEVFNRPLAEKNFRRAFAELPLCPPCYGVKPCGAARLYLGLCRYDPSRPRGTRLPDFGFRPFVCEDGTEVFLPRNDRSEAADWPWYPRVDRLVLVFGAPLTSGAQLRACHSSGSIGPVLAGTVFRFYLRRNPSRASRRSSSRNSWRTRRSGGVLLEFQAVEGDCGDRTICGCSLRPACHAPVGVLQRNHRRHKEWISLL
jgi:hypothetical protein